MITTIRLVLAGVALVLGACQPLPVTDAVADDPPAEEEPPPEWLEPEDIGPDWCPTERTGAAGWIERTACLSGK